jgi:N-acetylglutamate synthase-like GNAT family acetyltransferase
MSDVKIIELDPIRLPLIQKLYKAYYPSAKAKRQDLIYVAYIGTNIVGIVRFKTIDKWRLLTGLLVVPEYRNRGIAHQLVHFCQKNILTELDYCFAYQHLASFYAQHGFVNQALSNPPAQLLSLFERYTRSGKSLVLMRYQANGITP